MAITFEDLAISDIEFNEPSSIVKGTRPDSKNLGEDFYYWWKLPKYQKMDIPARKMSEVGIVKRYPSKEGWPNPAIEISYWVELENGYAVGFSELQKGKCTFPVVKMNI